MSFCGGAGRHCCVEVERKRVCVRAFVEVWYGEVSLICQCMARILPKTSAINMGIFHSYQHGHLFFSPKEEKISYVKENKNNSNIVSFISVSNCSILLPEDGNMS